MEDYKQKAKDLLLQFYSTQVEENWQKVYQTTESIHSMLAGVIPEVTFDHHDVYEIMTELEFKIENVENIMMWAMYQK